MAKKIWMAAAAALAMSVQAQELQFVPGPKMGINPIPVERNDWRGRSLAAQDYDGKNVTVCEEADFFTLEYGAPLEPFSFDVTPKGASRLWGERHDDKSGRAVRFQRGWYPYVYAQVQVRAEIDQTGAGEVTWTLFQHSRSGKRIFKTFKTKEGVNAIAQDLMMVRLGRLYEDGGLELVAKGADGIKATVRSFRICPTRALVSFRRKFTLAEKPWRAGVSVSSIQGLKVFVNGRLAHTLGAQVPRGVARFDLTDTLVVGANEIVVERDANAGWQRGAPTAVEVFAVGPDGKAQVFPGDGSWEARAGDGAWKPARLCGKCGQETLASGLTVATGHQPLHAGALDPKPVGTQWPVFDADGAVAYTLDLPPALAGAKVTAKAVDAFTGEAFETAEATAGSEILHQGAARRRTYVGEASSPPRNVLLAFRLRRPGAYRLAWTLADAAGKVVDTLRSEMLIIGKLGLDEFTAAGVEAELRNRLKPVDEIDCTAEPPAGEFLDHSGYYGKHVTGLGRVLERDGFKVRETGPGWLDLLSWRIRCGTLGRPHICEVDLPDTREQYAYCSVTETFPVGFCNNSPPPGARAWPSASGAAFSGGLMPLSGKMKTLRFLFVPSSGNLTFNVENGVYGKPAGIARVRVYEVKGSLPALKIPETDRIFANHCERPLFFNWGNSAVPYMLEYDCAYREGMWAGAYRAIVNRVQQLKFMGHNAAIEAGFMYSFGFKTRSGLSGDIDGDFDPCVPLLMMYAKNGIRAYLSYEFTGTPALMDGATRDTSDRDVAAGRPTVSFVDRYGCQSMAGGYGGQANFLDPRVRGAMAGVLREMYDRYAPLGVEGVVLQVNGCAWQPMYGGVTYGQPEDEVGYDDQTIALFERDTGVKLGADPKDPKRFAVRYDALHGDAALLATWRKWKLEQIAATHRALAAVVRTGRAWRYIVSPCCGKSTPEELGYTREYYPKDGPVELLPKAEYNREPEIATYTKMLADAALAEQADCDGVYACPVGLNEHNFNRVEGAKKWWWRSYGVIVYDMLPIGDNAFYDCASLCRDHTPKTFLHTWLDVNLPTGHDAASRRFLEGFYATPTGKGVPYPQVTGVTAHVYGGKLQLLNLTPYPLVADDGTTLKPYDLKVVGTPRPMRFRFADEALEAVRKIEDDLANPLVAERLPASARARLAKASVSYDRIALSRRGEVLDVLLRFAAAQGCFANQRRFEAALAKDGVARINCGAGEDWTDEKGVRWLPDQNETGFRAYGCRKGIRTARGEIAIGKTDRPSIYRTEASSGSEPMVYAFPVPEGTYRVVLHIADTFNKEDRGVKWVFGVGDERRTVNIWEQAGGTPATATVHVFDDVKPKDGLVTATFELAVVNGIEIYRK